MNPLRRVGFVNRQPSVNPSHKYYYHIANRKRKNGVLKTDHEEMEGMRGWVDSGASFIDTSGDPRDSDLASGDGLVGVSTPSALATGPAPGVEGDFCVEGMALARVGDWIFSEVGVAIVPRRIR